MISSENVSEGTLEALCLVKFKSRRVLHIVGTLVEIDICRDYVELCFSYVLVKIAYVNH